jgi:hypothetical protein
VDNLASNTAGLPDINAAAPSASGEPHTSTQPSKGIAHASLHIPAALNGRWALTPADCINGRASAKTLLVISGDELRFYDSRAVPAASAAADPNSISGNFAFDGQGRSWTKYEALNVNKQTLVRTEMNPTASFTYAKCN